MKEGDVVKILVDKDGIPKDSLGTIVKVYDDFLAEVEFIMENHIQVLTIPIYQIAKYGLTKDEVTNKVISDLRDRSRVGYKKYKTTLHENNKDNFLKHLYEELLDAAQYVKKEMMKSEDIHKLIEKYPNDDELGSNIRKMYGK